MNLQNIKTFLSVVEHRSISGAARTLFISQPAVSSQLNHLEKALGVQLIHRDRGTKAAVLTKAGADFIPLAQKWIQLSDQTEVFMKFHQSNKPNRYLRIGVSVSGYEYIFSEVIQQLMQEVPSLELKIKIIDRADSIKVLNDQEVDTVIAMGAPGNVPSHPLINSIPIMEEDRCILCPKNTLLPEGIITPQMLDPYFEIVFTHNTTDLTEWRNALFATRTKPYAEIDNIMTCYCYLTDPRCWTICPCSIGLGMVRTHPERLTYRMLSTAMPLRTCDLLVPKTYTPSNVIQKLIDTTLKYSETTTYLHPVRSNSL